MKRTDFIEKSLRRDRFMVIGTRCEMAGKEKDLIRSTADDVFDLMAEFYEDGFGEETFDFMMDIITEFVSMREYGLALIIQDMLLQKAGFEDEAASLSKFLGENPDAADMYLRQMTARSIIYHDNLIAEPCEDYTCSECPHRDCPDFYMTPEETESSLAEDIAKAVADAIDKDGEPYE